MTKVNGVVGVSGGELARYAVFYASLIQLQKPLGTAFMQSRGCIHENRNAIADQALQMEADWVLYLDDDQVLAPDTLMRLLAHDVDVVSALYLARSYPFQPHVYDREDERKWVFPRPLTNGSGGLVDVKATGAGCLLVKTKVLKALEKPYWRLGQITSDGWGDDVDFCRRVREAGFKVWADLDTGIGHMLNGAVWPQRQEDGSWQTLFIPRTEVIAAWPQVTPEEKATGIVGILP